MLRVKRILPEFIDQNMCESAENIDLILEKSWNKALIGEFQKSYFKQLITFLAHEKTKNQKIYPKEKDIFSAFNHTPFEQVKVVIIGQDPYHSFELVDGKELPHAHGLSFSIPKNAKKIPPSLKNIYKELQIDLDCAIPQHGNLENWAKQGVLMLNATLTVQAHEAGSHQKKGWEQFTNTAIQTLSLNREGVVFLLWGKFAQQKKELIDTSKHHVLEAAHPSPFSARNGFFGCRHFSTCNTLLEKMGNHQINWCIQ